MYWLAEHAVQFVHAEGEFIVQFVDMNWVAEHVGHCVYTVSEFAPQAIDE